MRVDSNPITDDQLDVISLTLDANSAVLPDFEVFADLGMRCNHDPGRMGNPQALANSGAQHDFNIELTAYFFVEKLTSTLPELIVLRM